MSPSIKDGKHDNDSVFGAIESGKPAAVYLITGDEFLVRKTSGEIVAKLLPKATAGLNLSIHDNSSPAEVARDLATVPMLRGRKVVVLRDPEFLAPKKGRVGVLQKIRDAWAAGRRKAAAQRALGLLARADWGVEQLLNPDQAAFSEELDLDLAEADLTFLRELGAFCKSENISALEDDSAMLEKLLNKGIPNNHHLIIEATQLDSRQPLVKLCSKIGVVVDKKVERELRKLDIHEVVAQVLTPLKKKLDLGAERLLKDLCGANMRLLESELEKLALFAGEKKTIGAADVELLVRRAREEEFRELADAIGNRDAKAAIHYIDTALDQDEPPLKIHGAMASIVRRLLEDRDRWQRLGFTARTSQRELEAKGIPILAEQSAKRGTKVPHPYVVWLGFQACMRFSLRELVKGMLAIASADLSLKSGGNSRLVLESLALKLCQKA